MKKLAVLGYTLNVVGPAEFAVILANERAEYAKVAEGGRLDEPN